MVIWRVKKWKKTYNRRNNNPGKNKQYDTFTKVLDNGSIYILSIPLLIGCMLYSLFMWNIKGVDMGEKIYDMCWSLVYE